MRQVARGLTLCVVLGGSSALAASPVGSEFRVNTATAGDQSVPAVAGNGNGEFVAAWAGPDGSGVDTEIFAQRYSSSGLPIGAEFPVNTFTTNDQGAPAVSMAPDGRFVVAWDSVGQDSTGADLGVFAQRYNADGSPAGLNFLVNSGTCPGGDGCDGNQGQPDVAMDGDGDFVIAWRSDNQDGSSGGVYAQRYGSGGSLAGAEFPVNTFTTNDQGAPAVSMAPDGRFVVAWDSVGQDSTGADLGVFAQTYALDGSAAGSNFLLNSGTCGGGDGCDGDQDLPGVAADSDGGFAAVWRSTPQDGSGYGIYGQRMAWDPAQATTQAASGVSETAATLHGVADPEGGTGSYRFDYGTTAAYEVGSTPVEALSGLDSQSVDSTVSGLSPGTTYHYRVVVLRGGRTFAGSDHTLTTSTPAPSTTVPPPSGGGSSDGGGSSGGGTSTGGDADGTGGGTEERDVVAPDHSLAGKPKQDIDKLALKSSSNEPATLAGTGTVKLPGKKARFVPASDDVGAAETTKLRFKLPRGPLRKAKALLADGEKLKAKLSVAARDAEGNESVKRRAVKLKN